MSVIKESDDSLFCLLFARQQMKMALTISLIVGTILNLINQGHLISTPEKINLVNIILTYCVPYCVATISSTLSTLKHQKKLQLIEENKINLKDTIQKFFPDIPYPGITIHQLLSHRSGMSQYTHFCDAPDSIWPNKSVTINNQDVIEIISRIVPLINYKPNHKYYYCNTNYLLLASIVEQVSGLSFKQYVKKYIFNPSGMFSSTIYDRTNFEDLVLPAQGYENKTPWEDVYLNGVVGDKGVYSTTEDLLKFDRALKENVFISDSLKKLAFSKMNLDKNGNKNYGYGFRLKEHEKYGKIVYHTGWWKGFRSYFIKVIDKNQTIVVLNNVKRGKFLNIDRLIELIN